MTALFYPPKFEGIANAKLTFSRTNTSTLQNTYTDEDLTVAHDNPVQADINGVFPPIYLDPTLPSYRVKYTTAAGVLIYQVDDYPSNQGVQQSMRLESADPTILLYDTDGTTNHRKYFIRVQGNQLLFQELNDAESVATTVFTCTNGIINLANGATVGGVAVSNYQSGTASLTYTGFTTAPTEDAPYTIHGGSLVVLKLVGVTATSNAASMTFTIPEAIRPISLTRTVLCRVIDNGGTASIGTASIAASGVVTFGLGAAGGAFTASGTKSLLDGHLVYLRTP